MLRIVARYFTAFKVFHFSLQIDPLSGRIAYRIFSHLAVEFKPLTPTNKLALVCKHARGKYRRNPPILRAFQLNLLPVPG